MELSVKDRLYLPSFLPARGNFKDFNLKKEILRKIAIPDEERKAIGLHENAEDKRIEWDVEKEKPLAVEFSGDEMEYLRKACERISDEELPDDMWATVSRIYDFIQEKINHSSSAATLLKRVPGRTLMYGRAFLLKYRSWQDRT